VSAPGMLIVALVGLAGNLANSAVLARDRGENLNLRVALTHTLADAAAAVGTIAASFVILTTGWVQADAAVSIGIAALILAGSWPPLHEAVRILMEGAPAHLSLTEVEEAMRGVPGVTGVHDLHIWSLTAGVEAVSGHVLVVDPGEGQRVLRDLCRLLSDRTGPPHRQRHRAPEAAAVPGSGPRGDPGHRRFHRAHRRSIGQGRDPPGALARGGRAERPDVPGPVQPDPRSGPDPRGIQQRVAGEDEVLRRHQTREPHHGAPHPGARRLREALCRSAPDPS